MCGGGTLPFLPTASINANRPCVSSPVARNVNSCPLYQTDCFKDCRPRPNAVRCSVPTVALNGVAMIGSFRFELKSATQPERGNAAQAAGEQIARKTNSYVATADLLWVVCALSL